FTAGSASASVSPADTHSLSGAQKRADLGEVRGIGREAAQQRIEPRVTELGGGAGEPVERHRRRDTFEDVLVDVRQAELVVLALQLLVDGDALAVAGAVALAPPQLRERATEQPLADELDRGVGDDRVALVERLADALGARGDVDAVTDVRVEPRTTLG